MFTVTLATRIYHESQPRQVDEALKKSLNGLNVQVTPSKPNSRGWLQVTASGEDETIALNYLAREFGLSTTQFENIRELSVTKGYVKAVDRDAVFVDVGVSSPEILDAQIPLQKLQAQLADGRKVAIKKISEFYGLITNLPLGIKILSASQNRFEAELAEKQVRLYAGWVESLLDRLIILGVQRSDIEYALRNAHLNRDIAAIEDLGLLEHSVVCKLGTDAVGLIPRIGYRLRHAAFAVFVPKRIIEFLEYDNVVLH